MTTLSAGNGTPAFPIFAPGSPQAVSPHRDGRRSAGPTSCVSPTADVIVTQGNAYASRGPIGRTHNHTRSGRALMALAGIGGDRPHPDSTVANGIGAMPKSISRKGNPVMGQRKPLATVAVTRGEFALLVFHDALTDRRSPGVIDEHEAPAVRDALADWHAATKASHRAESLSHAIKCGVGAQDGRYLVRLVEAYRETIDELPELVLA